MPSALTTPSAVRSSGRIQRGSRAAVARRSRLSCRARRKFGSRALWTAPASLMHACKPAVNKRYGGAASDERDDLCVPRQLPERVAEDARDLRLRQPEPGGDLALRETLLE